MNFRDWRLWIGSVPWRYRWFIILILARPIIDLTWNFRGFVFSISLLEIVGVLTPVIIVYLLLTKNISFVKRTQSSIGRYMLLWSLLLLFNALLIWLSEPSLNRLGLAIKITLPAYLFVFCRSFVKSGKELEGILQTVLYSAYLAFCFLLFEIIVSPFQVQASRGVERLMGGYADVASLGLYINIGFLLCSYFWFAGQKRKNVSLAVVIIVCVVGLFHINHAASYLIFAALLAFFFLYVLRTAKNVASVSLGIFLVLMLFLFSGAYLKKNIAANVMPLISQDIRVVKGEGDITSVFHGRGRRWGSHLQLFFEENTRLEQLFGFAGTSRPYLVSAGAHNDYLRILFASGFVGLALYLLLIWNVFLRTARMGLPQKFLIRGILLIIMMQSISLTPMFYNVVNYTVIPLFVYTELAQYRRKKYA